MVLPALLCTALPCLGLQEAVQGSQGLVGAAEPWQFKLPLRGPLANMQLLPCQLIFPISNMVFFYQDCPAWGQGSQLRLPQADLCLAHQLQDVCGLGVQA